MDKDSRDIYIRLHQSRGFLRVHGFLPDAENAKIVKRIEAYATKNGIPTADERAAERRLKEKKKSPTKARDLNNHV